jgi:hypothetical protein
MNAVLEWMVANLLPLVSGAVGMQVLHLFWNAPLRMRTQRLRLEAEYWHARAMRNDARARAKALRSNPNDPNE